MTILSTEGAMLYLVRPATFSILLFNTILQPHQRLVFWFPKRLAVVHHRRLNGMQPQVKGLAAWPIFVF
uniref:Uncharacterized protein n=1 Tax=Helianthus annuus TaxID=4232 RepID=A0A251SD16_HELAN